MSTTDTSGNVKELQDLLAVTQEQRDSSVAQVGVQCVERDSSVVQMGVQCVERDSSVVQVGVQCAERER